MRRACRRPAFAWRRGELNVVLAFSGFYVREDGKVGHADKATTLDAARARAGRLKAALESRVVHAEVLNYCRAMSQEIAELTDSVPWKWWAKYQKLDIQNARVEVVDLFHFLISLAQVLGMGADEVFAAYLKNLGLRRSDGAMVIASHNLDELERLCDRVAILDKGKVQQVVTVRGIDGANTVSVRRWRIRVVSGAAVLAGLVPGAKVDGEIVECECDLPAMNRALAAAIAGGALVGAVAPVESSLEEAFRVSVTR